MNAFQLLQLGLVALQAVLAQSKAGNLPAEIVADIEAAVEKLQSVHGSDVTKAQLEALRG